MNNTMHISNFVSSHTKTSQIWNSRQEEADRGDKYISTVQCSPFISVLRRWWRGSCHGSYGPHGSRCCCHFTTIQQCACVCTRVCVYLCFSYCTYTHTSVCLFTCVHFHINLWVLLVHVLCECLCTLSLPVCVHSCMWFVCYCNMWSVCDGLWVCELLYTDVQ